MDFKNFTIKAQEAVQKATEIAGGNQQQAVETGHSLKGLFQSDESVFSFLANKLGANRNILTPRLDAIVAVYPKVSGGSPYFANDAATAWQPLLLPADARGQVRSVDVATGTAV